MPVSSEGQARPSIVSLAKAEGAFLALAAGDALGWPQEMPRNVQGSRANEGTHVEFKEWTRRSGGRFQPYEEIIHSGEYSDDTQLTLAVARSRTNHGPAWWKAFTRIELPLWTLYERGGGGATKRAANAWAGGNPPWKSSKRESICRYFDAGGNGVAMRVLPHALFLAGQDTPTTLMHDVVLDGSATHGHPRALVGATVYAYAAWSLTRLSNTLRFGELLDTLIDEAPVWSRFPTSTRNGGSWFEAANDATDARYGRIWEQTTHEMRELLEKARKGLQAGALADDHAVLKDIGCFGRAKGAGTSSAAGAAYLAARHAAQPVQGILRAAFEKGADTDTLAAMAGGLMGCLSGIEWLPQPWLQVQDAEYLRDIAARVAQGPEGASERPVEPLPHPQSILSDLAQNGCQERNLGSATRVVVAVLMTPKPIGKSVWVRAWRLRTADGQTMYVTKVGRLPKESREKASAYKRVDRDPQQTHRSRSNDGVAATTSPAPEPKDILYKAFCQQLHSLLKSAGELKSKEIGDAFGLVQSQATGWLIRAAQDRYIEQASKRPIKFRLPPPLLQADCAISIEMKPRSGEQAEFAVCISNDDYPASLELYKIYRFLPDDDAASDGNLRVVDESGEDCLYPASCFSSISVSAELEASLLNAS